MLLRCLHLLLAPAFAIAAAAGCAAPDQAGGPAAPGPSSNVTTLQKSEDLAAMLPEAIKTAGAVKVASAPGFPPMEFLGPDNKTPIGFDIDLGDALGQVLGVDFRYEITNFDGVIGGIKSGRYDLGLTSMVDKPSRQAEVDFVDYLSSGTVFMTLKGNPDLLVSAGDLCGRTVAVEKGASGDFIADDISADCVKQGKPAVEKLAFPDQPSAVQALQSGRANAVLTLDLSLAYSVQQNPDAFEIPSKPMALTPIGMPVDKGNAQLRDAVQKALIKVQESGVYEQLLAKWNLTDQSLLGAPINSGK